MFYRWIPLVLLFLEHTTTLNLEEVTNNYINIIKGFHDNYNFNEIFMFIPSNCFHEVENVINKIMEIPQVAFIVNSIQTMVSTNYVHNHHRLILYMVNNVSLFNMVYFTRLQQLPMTQINMIIALRPVINSYEILPLDYVDTVVIENGSLYKAFYDKLSPTTISDFFLNDSYNNPEANFPRLKRTPFFHAHNNHLYFPAVVLGSESITGVIGFAVVEILKYFNDRLQRKLGFDHNQTYSMGVSVYLNTVAKPSGLGYVYPLIRSEECFLLPIMEEILTQNFIKQPFTQSTWISTLITLVCLTGFLRLLVFNDLFFSFFECLSLTCGSVHRGVKVPGFKTKITYLILYLYGFIIYNLHMSKLSSYLCTPNIGRRIETIEDIK